MRLLIAPNLVFTTFFLPAEQFTHFGSQADKRLEILEKVFSNVSNHCSTNYFKNSETSVPNKNLLNRTL